MNLAKSGWKPDNKRSDEEATIIDRLVTAD